MFTVDAVVEETLAHKKRVTYITIQKLLSSKLVLAWCQEKHHHSNEEYITNSMPYSRIT